MYGAATSAIFDEKIRGKMQIDAQLDAEKARQFMFGMTAFEVIQHLASKGLAERVQDDAALAEALTTALFDNWNASLGAKLLNVAKEEAIEIAETFVRENNLEKGN